MRQFVYVSTAAELDQSDLSAILKVSQENNLLAGLSGFLLFNGRNFMQLLEGPEAALAALMNRLARDWRHTGMVGLEDRPITERAFPEWHMRRIHLSEALEDRDRDLRAMLPEGFDAQIERTVLNFARLN